LSAARSSAAARPDEGGQAEIVPSGLGRRRRGTSRQSKEEVVVGIIIGLLVLWVIVAVVGFTVKSLLWLALGGIVLFVATGIVGGVRRRSLR